MAEYNYVVGPARGNQQTITIQHKWNGDGQVVVSTPEKINEYVRKMKKAPMQDEFTSIGLTVAGCGAGYLAGLAKSKIAGGYGAILGLFAGLLTACFMPGKQERLTKEFLKNNVQG